ncbi:MAG: DUF2203 family protein [Candidatus Omnitrophica bacterium]|nr:DUF2203 family protein [Candidatus Omnitrophota bacterium]
MIMKSLKIFTLEEANALIPVLETRMGKIFAKREAHAQRHDVLFMHQLLESAEGHAGYESVSPELEREIQQMEDEITKLEKDVEEIHSLGCIVRSLEKGFIDFFSYHHGKKVFLCWKKGENTIRYYHSSKDGMTQRLPL